MKIVALILIVIVWKLYFSRLNDERKYNNGVCCKCGGRLRHFATDSQGGEGYVCDNCGTDIWVSWYNPEKERMK